MIVREQDDFPSQENRICEQFCDASQAVRSRTQTIIATLEDQILRLIEHTQVVGLSIAIINDGQVIWSKGFGFKDLEDHQPVERETIFEAVFIVAVGSEQCCLAPVICCWRCAR